ncbi:hypothetical protein HN51_047003, partial [Arachis hypogaea]
MFVLSLGTSRNSVSLCLRSFASITALHRRRPTTPPLSSSTDVTSPLSLFIFLFLRL